MYNLPDHFLFGKALFEHHQYTLEEDVLIEEDLKYVKSPLYFKNRINEDFCCFSIDFTNKKPLTSYFIGTDWLSNTNDKAVYIQPKLNKDCNTQIDYVQMLFTLLRHPETLSYVNEIYEIKWDSKTIEINQEQDQLTPLLVVHFLNVVQHIVRKGLKKTYYNVENNLNAKVKGKVLVGPTIKHNLLRNKTLNTWCSYDEFGLNGLENRLLKKALIFVQRYLSSHKSLVHTIEGLSSLFNYINSAFENISPEVSLHEVKNTTTNVFYKDYAEGIRLAKLILKRFGYNISNTQHPAFPTPPFWIDMSKLFELYVFSLLKSRYDGEIEYQFQATYGQLDYLLVKQELIVDAKYKTYYNLDFSKLTSEKRRNNVASDIRQISGYARDIKVLAKLGKSKEACLSYLPKCLIIYPDQKCDNMDLNDIDSSMTEIKEFVGFFKVSIRLPEMKSSLSQLHLF